MSIYPFRKSGSNQTTFIELERFVYNPEAQINGQNSCAICFDAFAVQSKIVKTACGHIFHESCFSSALLKCPTCEYPLNGRIQYYSDKELYGIFHTFLESIKAMIDFRLLENEESEKVLGKAGCFSTNAPQHEHGTFLQNCSAIQMIEQFSHLLPILLKASKHPSADGKNIAKTLLPLALAFLHQTFKEPDLYRYGPITYQTYMKQIISSTQALGNFYPYFQITMHKDCQSFLLRILEQYSDNPQVQSIFRHHKECYTQIVASHIQELGFFQRLSFMDKLRDNKVDIEALAKEMPELKPQKTILIKIPETLGYLIVMFGAAFILYIILTSMTSDRSLSCTGQLKGL